MLMRVLRKVYRKSGLPGLVYRVQKPLLENRVLPDADAAEARRCLEAFSADAVQSCRGENSIGSDYDLEIIIPAYKVERYLHRCMRSVLDQKTGYRVHVTCIDDGSPDATGAMLDEYGGREDLVIIHQKNQGLSAARNAGMRVANGKYLMFVDSDDELMPGALETLLSVAFAQDADIVQGGWVRTTQDGIAFEQYPFRDGPAAADELSGFACGKLLKSDLFRDVVFPVNTLFEDSVMRQIVQPRARRIYGVKTPVYRYRANLQSISYMSQKAKKSLDSLWITLRLYEDRKYFGLKTDQAYYEYLLRMAVLTYQRTKDMPEEVKRAIFVVYADFLARNCAQMNTQKHGDLERALRTGRYALYRAYCQSVW